MSRFFNLESPIFSFLNKLADLLILNVIFIATCLPVVTIGAAWTALYYMTLKIVRGEESYIVKGYFKSFKQNFRQSTIIWLIVMVFGFILYLDFNIMSNAAEGTMQSAMRVGLAVILILAAMILMYLFPLMAKFYNTIKNTIANALLMSIRHLPFTAIMIAVHVGAVMLTFLNNVTFVYGTLFWIMFGFSIVALINSWFLVRIFDKYIPEEEQTDPDEFHVLEE